jgi:phosphate/sulfate permease
VTVAVAVLAAGVHADRLNLTTLRDLILAWTSTPLVGRAVAAATCLLIRG